MMKVLTAFSARSSRAVPVVLALVFCQLSFCEAGDAMWSSAARGTTSSPISSRANSKLMSCARAASVLEAGQKLPRTALSDADPSIDRYQVTVLAAVDPHGKLMSVSIEQTSGCALLDKAALRATAKMKWRADKSYHANRVVWVVQNQF